MSRRLAAILSIDVVAYSRLMERDEDLTLRALNSHRVEVIEPCARLFGGTTVKLMGDGALMEFASAVDAVRFAVAVQIGMLERNDREGQIHGIIFRIGINVGDVIAEDGDLHGDGVNLAVRLEALAEPGGICIHRSVYDQIRDKLDLNVEDLGETQVKNLARPVRAFKVMLDDKAIALNAAPIEEPEQAKTFDKRLTFIGAACTLVLLVALGWWQPWRQIDEAIDPDELAHPLPLEPSIVILPFENRSDDVDIGYLAEGFGTAITTQLSKFPQLFVIAGSTAITFAENPGLPRDIGRELGVRYVLTGSVHDHNNMLSVNATLVEAESEHAIWSEQYEFSAQNVFSAQAALVQEITTTLKVVIEEEEIADLAETPTDSLEAYDLYLRAVAKSRLLNTAGRQEAIELLKQALMQDPDFLAAHVELGSRYLSLWRFDGADDPEEALNMARYHVARALELDQADYRVQHKLGQIHLFADHDHELAFSAFKRALRSNPNDPEVLYGMGFLRSLMGEAAEAIEWNEKAKRVNPRYPGWYNFNAALSNFFLKNYDQALLLAKTGIATYPKSLPPRRILVATLAEMGKLEEAQSEAAKLLAIRPDFRISTHRNTPFQHQDDQDRYFDAMRAGGLPD